VLTLIVGLVGAMLLAASAGARRTGSSLRRFDDSSRSADVTLLPVLGYAPSASKMAALRRMQDEFPPPFTDPRAATGTATYCRVSGSASLPLCLALGTWCG
jgi:hypothetical protein